MPHAERVRRGDGFLPGFSLQDLQEMRDGERDPKARTILQAAIHRKTGLSLDRIVEAIGFVRSTVYGWLARLAAGGVQRRHDRKSPGRPCRLDERQRVQLDGIIRESPERSGFHSDMWISRMVAGCIWKVFGVRYSHSGALRLTGRMGFSVRKRRPVPQNTAGREEIERYVKDAARKIVSFHRRGHTLFCLDACTIVNSPAPRYGILPRGERDTTCISRSRKGVHVLGALGSESVELDYPESLKSEGVIAFLRRLHGKHGRILVILDNAGAHKSRAMGKYLESTEGEVALLFLPPRTPQHNPIEMLWREIKKAISNTYFDGEDEMKERIARLVGEGGIPRIRLLWYMREAVCSAEGARPASLPAPDPSPNRTPVEPPCRRGRPRCRLALQNRAPVAF